MNISYFLNFIHSAGKEMGITFEEVNPGLVYKAKCQDKSFFMHGNDIGLNSSSSVQLAKNKDLTFSILDKENINAIPHYFLLNPNSIYRKENIYNIAEKLFLENNSNVVIKPSDSSEGKHCYHITHIDDLRLYLKIIFTEGYNVCLSPFLESELEYRVVVLDHKPQLCFAKRRLNSWKHNLTGGNAFAEEVLNPLLKAELFQLSIEVSKIMGLRFCSIDFFLVKDVLNILEVNSTVYLAGYIQSSEERYILGKQTIQNAFNLKLS